MNDKTNNISLLKENIFILIEYLNKKILSQITQNRIDAQGVYALVKLIDSYLKLYNTEMIMNITQDNTEKTKELNEDDSNMLKNYKEKMAPRAGFEPATKRLTAACSTTELPRNNNL
jgi:hypothetical protein